jgi:hypothetical protein
MKFIEVVVEVDRDGTRHHMLINLRNVCKVSRYYGINGAKSAITFTNGATQHVTHEYEELSKLIKNLGSG